MIFLELWCSTEYFYQNRKLQPGSEQDSQNEPAEDPASSQRAAAAEQAAHSGSNLFIQQSTYIVNYSGEVHELRLIPPSRPLKIPAMGELQLGEPTNQTSGDLDKI